MKIFPLCFTVLLLAACSHTPDDAKDHGNDPSPAPVAAASSSDADTSETVASPAESTTDDVASATTDAASSSVSDSSETTKKQELNVFNAYHYKEYNVTCFWLENNNSSFSMSCLPDSQVTRTPENEATETPQ